MIKKSRKKNLLLIIDMQHDFAANGGSLYVPGAEEDVLRVAKVIVKHDKAIDHIIFTQDTHHVLDISHPGFWRNEKGESPEPFTEIKSMQVAKGEWIPIEDTGYVLNYLENLEAKGEFPHVVWPEHCLIGSVGHALVPPLVEKAADWARKGRRYEVVQKGINPMTEHFGALRANVPIDDAPETQLNMALVDQLHQFENIIRFKNLEAINWRGILWFFARQFIKLSKKENGGKSPRCLIFDDSVLQKSGKFIERISRVWDHVTGRCVLGYKLLVAVYWDGSSCIPVDYSIHREKGKKKDMPFGLKKKVMKNQFRKARNHSSSAYERIKETDVSKIASMVAMLKRALRNKLEVDYVLMDSWFTCWEVVSLIIKRKGLHLIGMYKGAKTKFDYMGKSLTYSQVRNELGNPIRCRRLGYYYKQAIVQWNGKQVRLFFSKQGKNGKWKTFMSTNTSLSFIEMVKIYQLRWCIEVFFKESKQLFGLGKCQSTDFDAQIADTTMVMIRYMMASLKYRFDNYESKGAIFEQTKEKAVMYSLGGHTPLNCIAGEAKSHCIANTLKQILELEKYSFNLTVLDDCMSPVPGFEKIADPIYQKARDAGVQFIKSKDLILT
jgi:nicotinamidase-related amidase